MPALVYVVSIAPALVVALVHWLIAKTPILTVVGTTLFAYGVAVLYLAWDGSARYIFALGVISGPFCRVTRPRRPLRIEPAGPTDAPKPHTFLITATKKRAMKALTASIRVAVIALALGLSLSAPSYAAGDEAGTLTRQMQELNRAGN